jgi:hypothetical protein
MLFPPNKQNMVRSFAFTWWWNQILFSKICVLNRARSWKTSILRVSLMRQPPHKCLDLSAPLSLILHYRWDPWTEWDVPSVRPVDGVGCTQCLRLREMRWIKRHIFIVMGLCRLKIRRAWSHEVRWWFGRGHPSGAWHWDGLADRPSVVT